MGNGSNFVTSPLTLSEEQKDRKILKDRKEFAIYDVHKIANLLDPHLKGCDLTPAEETSATEQIYNTAAKIPDVDEDTVLSELANYIAKQGFFSKSFLWSAANKLTPIAWWMGLCKSTALSKVSLRFLSLPTTSAACERTFSTYSDIHSKKRNRLTNDRAGKIVYIAHNLKLQSQSISLSEPHEKPENEIVTVSEIINLEETEESENSDSDVTDMDKTSVGETDSDTDSETADSNSE